jgi:hypothetical protein
MQTAYRNILIGLVAGGALLSAGSVTIPNEFTANTTAKASEVNANFTAVKTAVDGNAADITTNATAIATNASAIAGTITGVNAGAGLGGGGTSGDVNVSLSATSVPISASAFESKNETNDYCELVRHADYVYFATTSTSSSCKAYASVPVPNNATIIGVKCWATHNDATTDTVIKLHEIYPHRLVLFSPYSMTTNTVATLTYDSPDSDMKSKYEKVTSLHAHNFLTDGISSFVLEYDPSNPSTAGGNEKLHACHVYYEFD